VSSSKKTCSMQMYETKIAHPFAVYENMSNQPKLLSGLFGQQLQTTRQEVMATEHSSLNYLTGRPRYAISGSVSALLRILSMLLDENSMHLYWKRHGPAQRSFACGGGTRLVVLVGWTRLRHRCTGLSSSLYPSNITVDTEGA
jgi:hypothetical protein